VPLFSEAAGAFALPLAPLKQHRRLTGQVSDAEQPDPW